MNGTNEEKNLINANKESIENEIKSINESDINNPESVTAAELDDAEQAAVMPERKIVMDHNVYAGFWMRFWAYLADIIVINAVQAIIVKPFAMVLDWELNGGMFTAYSIGSAIIFYLYFVLMTKYFSQTLGKMIFGLKVIPLNGEKLTWSTVLFREWIGRYISATVLILYTLVAFLPKNQGLHDLFADTAVIRVEVIKKEPVMTVK